MKEIQGKIKFVAIPLINGMIGYLPLRYEKIGLLSEITEEQAAEFVEYYYFDDRTVYKDYTDVYHQPNTAKESLISLLKANDVWIKEWCNDKNKFNVYNIDEAAYDVTECIARWNNITQGEKKLVIKFTPIKSLPDDLLLIKLQ